MSKHELARMQSLTSSEIDLVGGGNDDIIVTARLVRLDGGSTFGGSYSFEGGGFNFGSGVESGGGGITIELDPIDSDGDGTPDENDEAPYDASNNTIVVTAPTIDVTAPFSREARDAARFALQQDQYINDIAGKFFEDPIYYFDRTAQLFGADPGLVNSLAEAGLDNRFVNYARQYDANRAAAEFFGVVGNEP
jgi:hypothetical protein